MFIDTHCHLDCIATFGTEKSNLTEEHLVAIDGIVNQAERVNVRYIFNVGCDALSSHNSVKLAHRFKQVFAIVGIHPYEGKAGWKKEFDEIKKIVKHRSQRDKIIGIGEIGLDFSRQESDRQSQHDLLKAQLELALQHNLPISFHLRDAAEEFLKFIEPYHREVRGVVHCFQQTLDFAKQVTSWGFLLGIDGPITYPKNTYLRSIIAEIDLKYLLLETDAPFLPVQSERGKMNYPSKIPLIGQEVATCKGLSLDQVAQATTKNASILFSLDSFL